MEGLVHPRRRCSAAPSPNTVVLRLARGMRRDVPVPPSGDACGGTAREQRGRAGMHGPRSFLGMGLSWSTYISPRGTGQPGLTRDSSVF